MSEEKSDRGYTWDEEEISSIINIWADENIQQALETCSRKRPIFEKIAKSLEESGFIRSYSQIREKIKQLKQKYKKMKDNNNLSGRDRKKFKHFDKMDEIMGCRPITRPTNLLEGGSQAIGSDESDNDSLEQPVVATLDSQVSSADASH